MSEFLTHSRSASFKGCRKRHWWEYELGIRPTIDAKALRMGTAIHVGLDLMRHFDSLDEARRFDKLDDAFGAAEKSYDKSFFNSSEQTEVEERLRELMTVQSLISGYFWRWWNSLELVESEFRFTIPLRNPATGAPTPNYQLAGKIDAIVKLEDGRLAILETKTLSEDLSEGSDYWTRLQIDTQPTLYVYAARQLGYDVSTVLWDAIRKPSIRPEAVPILDDRGYRIVVDQSGSRVFTKDGKKPRETASAADGYVLQTRPMTVYEWGVKVTDDIARRPEFYFARREIARLDQEIDELQEELWDLQKTLQDAKLRGRWYRTVGRDTCPFCPFFGLCASKFDPTQALPDGFFTVTDVHPELAGSVTKLHPN